MQYKHSYKRKVSINSASMEGYRSACGKTSLGLEGIHGYLHNSRKKIEGWYLWNPSEMGCSCAVQPSFEMFNPASPLSVLGKAEALQFGGPLAWVLNRFWESNLVHFARDINSVFVR